MDGRFLSGGIILGSPLSCPDLFLHTITLPAVSRDAPATLSYNTLEMASRVLLSSKKSAWNYTSISRIQSFFSGVEYNEIQEMLLIFSHGCFHFFTLWPFYIYFIFLLPPAMQEARRFLQLLQLLNNKIM
jgi:hypothetical protein